ncbi:hypothetical protein POSPLADRAFT_1032493 [Postia placenta MAD-698-R-SB12]|uniref:Uncharacterized protein n=1 Tax=Postia placenta MAD-698-R-SB12 TaxID=670580 RepID=A0A1X6N693_9APHY|nr:hypothetical protein POSPLADRAFT_1032493 [Postia placenta MAD-698-R-SB12]OSX64006.1 hypothetical protein POSPLADRAFT_1032493 [Postia placenta MAD-698-R-SB12]
MAAGDYVTTFIETLRSADMVSRDNICAQYRTTPVSLCTRDWARGGFSRDPVEWTRWKGEARWWGCSGAVLDAHVTGRARGASVGQDVRRLPAGRLLEGLAASRRRGVGECDGRRCRMKWTHGSREARTDRDRPRLSLGFGQKTRVNEPISDLAARTPADQGRFDFGAIGSDAGRTPRGSEGSLQEGEAAPDSWLLQRLPSSLSTPLLLLSRRLLWRECGRDPEPASVPAYLPRHPSPPHEGGMPRDTVPKISLATWAHGMHEAVSATRHMPHPWRAHHRIRDTARHAFEKAQIQQLRRMSRFGPADEALAAPEEACRKSSGDSRLPLPLRLEETDPATKAKATLGEERARVESHIGFQIRTSRTPEAHHPRDRRDRGRAGNLGRSRARRSGSKSVTIARRATPLTGARVEHEHPKPSVPAAVCGRMSRGPAARARSRLPIVSAIRLQSSSAVNNYEDSAEASVRGTRAGGDFPGNLATADWQARIEHTPGAPEQRRPTEYKLRRDLVQRTHVHDGVTMEIRVCFPWIANNARYEELEFVLYGTWDPGVGVFERQISLRGTRVQQ